MKIIFYILACLISINLLSSSPLKIDLFKMGTNEVIELLEAGADPNENDEDGRTALHYAALLCKRSSVQHLLSHGANPNAKDEFRQTPLHMVAYSKQGGCPNVARLLLTRGAKIDAISHFEETPLFIAAKYGKERIVRVLLESGADPHKTNFTDNNMLHAAAQGQSFACMDQLIQHGVDATACDCLGRSVLYEAVLSGCYACKIFELLLQNDADPFKIDQQDNKTPLQLARETYNLGALYVLERFETLGASGWRKYMKKVKRYERKKEGQRRIKERGSLVLEDMRFYSLTPIRAVQLAIKKIKK